MRLTNTSFVVLGMLNIGARSGYDIKRAVQLSARHFWKISPVQVYSELQKLEGDGLIVGQDDPDSARKRRNYELTDRGRAELRAWLEREDEQPFELRDSGLLKLFFADAVDTEQAIAHVRRLRERSEQLVEEFEASIEPVAEATREHGGIDFPAHTARLGLELHRWLADWYRRLERELGS